MMQHLFVKTPQTQTEMELEPLEQPCVTSVGTGNTSETDRDLLCSLEDVLLPTEHGSSLMSRALTPRLWTI